MAFTQNAVDYRREYNLDDPADREIVRKEAQGIRIFEREMEEYGSREPVVVMAGTIFEKKLKGFELYLHENHLFHYTREYPSGAVVLSNIGIFRDVEMKKRAIDNLRFRRRMAEEERNRQFEGTPVGEALEMLGGTVVTVDPLTEELEANKKSVKRISK